MLSEIRKLAAEAVERQNKIYMENTLKKIIACCDAGLDAGSDEIEAGDVLVGADGREFTVEEVLK